MRSIRYFLFVGITSLLTLSLMTCGDDDNPVESKNRAPAQPTVDVDSGSPSHGSTNVSIIPTLHWKCTDPDGDALKYDVYFGTSSTPLLVSSGQTATSYTPEALEYDTTYYWKVIAKDNQGATTSSDVWRFTTLQADYIFANVTSTETDIALVLKNRDDEKLVVLADKTGGGQMATVTGGVYVTPSGGTYTFWFGDDGLPEYVIIDTWFFRFYNYTNNTVDIIGIDQDGNWNHWLEVDVDAGALDSLRDLVADGPVSFSTEGLVQPLSAGGMLTPDALDWAKALRVASLGVSVGGCAIGVTAAITGVLTPVGAVIAGATCGSAIVGVGRLITTGDLSGDGGGSMAVSAFTCALGAPIGQPDGCITLGLDLLADGIDEDTDVRDEKSEYTEFYLRLTLTWGENPRDLDSHLWTPSIEGSPYHVYFGSKGSENSRPYAQLDVDDVSSYGPENITIKRLFNGRDGAPREEA